MEACCGSHYGTQLVYSSVLVTQPCSYIFEASG